MNTITDTPGIVPPQTAKDFLVAMAGMYKYDISALESLLWTSEVLTQYEDRAIIGAFKSHMESGGRDADFMPKYGAIKNKLERNGGFLDIEKAVRTGNPYQIPAIHDPVLIEAINLMGGWSKVCAEMPDGVEKPIDFDRYVKRFDTSIAHARNKVNIHREQPSPLRALESPKQARFAIGQSPAALALPSPDVASDTTAPPVEPLPLTDFRQMLRPKK